MNKYWHQMEEREKHELVAETIGLPIHTATAENPGIMMPGYLRWEHSKWVDTGRRTDEGFVVVKDFPEYLRTGVAMQLLDEQCFSYEVQKIASAQTGDIMYKVIALRGSDVYTSTRKTLADAILTVILLSYGVTKPFGDIISLS